jgi:phenylpyruvate tautomerase PptA (4-oxalocrotonate tautomerase family)
MSGRQGNRVHHPVSGSPREEETAIIDAVHAALIAAFRIPAKDKHVGAFRCMSRIVLRTRRRWPNLKYATLVSVDCFAGRSVEAKRRLYGEIVDRLEPLGIPRDHVSITLRESPTENWGIRGWPGCM